jgi:hypothetical protein
MAGTPKFQALTIKASGTAAQIITDLSVSQAFDPASASKPFPPTLATKALWDTGASKSVISQALVKALSLTPTGATNVNHAGGMSVSPTHLVNFYLPNKVGIVGVLVTEFPGTGNFGAIIGMDVITMGDLAITNVSGQTWMSFRIPSMVAVDYVAEHFKALYASVGRNDPCPCGSGEKFKRCHGK